MSDNAFAGLMAREPLRVATDDRAVGVLARVEVRALLFEVRQRVERAHEAQLEVRQEHSRGTPTGHGVVVLCFRGALPVLQCRTRARLRDGHGLGRRIYSEMAEGSVRGRGSCTGAWPVEHLRDGILHAALESRDDVHEAIDR